MRKASRPSRRKMTNADNMPCDISARAPEVAQMRILKVYRAMSDQSSRISICHARQWCKLIRIMKLTTKGLAAALPAAGGISVFAQQGVFRSGTRIVPVYATVTDAQKRLVPDLAKTDFEILDNEKLQAVQLIEHEVQPITVVVMLDTSASMTGNLGLLSNAAEQFLLRLLPKDKGMVGAFNDK